MYYFYFESSSVVYEGIIRVNIFCEWVADINVGDYSNLIVKHLN